MRFTLFFILISLLLSSCSIFRGKNEVVTKGEKTTIDKAKKKKNKYATITKNASLDDGLFKVYEKAGKYYYEIPASLLGKDMLMVTRIAKIPSNLSPFLNAGSKTNEQVVRWDLVKDKVHLKSISYNSVASDSLPISKSVSWNNLAPIIHSFDVESKAQQDHGVLIEVTKLFTEDISALSGVTSSVKRIYKVSRLDKSRSYIDTIKTFPQNVEAIHTMTYKVANPPTNSKSGTLTFQMNQSMIVLPEEKMVPRKFDERIGWFTTKQVDYSSEALKSDDKTYINRWKLIPKDKEAYLRGELVEPENPIIYYLDPGTPEKWRPYFKQGIEDWQVAFEKAGFKNAIIAKDPPTEEEDPDFSPEDTRYSTVRYVASKTRNAVGPSVVDPRTGQILESDIIWYHNHLRSYRNRYLIETGAANPDARTLETRQAAIGDMMRRVICHEIGHALGLPHNMKASAAYPVDSLRSSAFTQKYGIATTIMDYARFNYVAQPGDQGIRFIRQLGPYDIHAIEYGYRWYPEVEVPEDEADILHDFVSAKSEDKMYMFGSGYPRFDPDSQTECVGDDPIKASTLGIKNLKIVADNLVDWTAKAGANYDDTEEVYGELVGIWNRYVGHVITLVGGVRETLRTHDQGGNIYNPVSPAEQKAAVQWLIENTMQSPTWLVQDQIIDKISYSGALEKIRSTQARQLSSLLDESRLVRMSENEFKNKGNVYTLKAMLADVMKGAFSDVYASTESDIIRRAMQRSLLDKLDVILNKTESNRRGSTFSNGMTDTNAILKSELRSLKAKLKSKGGSGLLADHYMDLADRIDNILNPA